MSKWISVDKKLPDIGNQSAPFNWSKSVLCILLDKSIHIMSLTDMGNWINFDGQYSTVNVTHWMSLPEPPENE